MATPSRRLHARYACSLPARLWSRTIKTPLDIVVTDVGIGGCFLRVKAELSRESVRLEIATGKSPISVNGTVVREAGPDPKDAQARCYGVEFVLDRKTEEKIRVLVDRIRSGRDPSVNLPLKDYWSL